LIYVCSGDDRVPELEVSLGGAAHLIITIFYRAVTFTGNNYLLAICTKCRPLAISGYYAFLVNLITVLIGP
jgi:hypothetical protein